MRIAILNTQDRTVGFIDNDVRSALHYFDDTLHTYLEGTAATFKFTTAAAHEDADLLQVGYKIAFQYADRDYYMQIVETEETETEITVTAYSGSLELINETCTTYSGSSKLFTEYLAAFDTEQIITVGINEVSTSRRSNEWQGEESLLARLFSLANVFDAEIELIPKLRSDYSLNGITMNVYKAHSDTCQGVGTDRRDVRLRYGRNITGIKRTSDLTQLYTAIKPTGSSNMTLKGWEDRTVLDDDGNVLYQLKKSDGIIYAQQARNRFPSNINTGDRYLVNPYSYDTSNKETLYGQALAQLKKYSVPLVSYSITGFIDAGIGDTFTIIDEAFNPALYLTARVTEQEISTTDPRKNKTTFDNIEERSSQISAEIIKRMQEIAAENAPYALTVTSSAGSVFGYSTISTTLTAHIYKGETELSAGDLEALGLVVTWEGSDGSTAQGLQLTVTTNARTIYYRAKLEDSNGD